MAPTGGCSELAVKAARMINLPYCCVDFLFDGSQYWLSEVELDGGIPYVHREGSRALLKARFEAIIGRTESFWKKRAGCSTVPEGRGQHAAEWTRCV